jgi:flavin reductase (DIM6/NTAB) family NADH-FMN oxidoreductase RutF
MDLDLSKLPAQKAYALLTSIVVPRPIALVTSLSAAGQLNAAPFSFFNLIGSDPALVIISPGHRSTGELKDTAQNIDETGEFVVNLVDEPLAPAMNICAIDFPRGQSEVEAAGLLLTPSIVVKPPRLKDSPASLECRRLQTLDIGKNHIILGQILHLSVRDDLIDPATLHILPQLKPIGRMGVPSSYARTEDRFELPRITYEQWLEKQK